MLADGADPQSDRRLEHHDPGGDDGQRREPDHQVELAEHGPDEVPVRQEAEVDVRDLGDVRRRSLAAVDVDEEIAGDPEREEVDREPADDLVRAQMDREEGVDEREASSRQRRTQEPERPRVQLVGAEDAEEGAREHHPLEADVHDAAPLARRGRPSRRTRAGSRTGAWRPSAPTRRRPGRGGRRSTASRGSRARSRGRRSRPPPSRAAARRG